jgi:transcription antitermination factor NusG
LAKRVCDWLVAYTEANSEAKAVRFGPLFGLSCYCPQTYAVVGRGRLERPLFPRYLFVANSWSGAAAAARRVFGVAGLIRQGNNPALIGQGAIDAVKAREIGGVIPPPPSSPPARVLRPGMRIKVDSAVGLVDAVFRARRGHKRSLVYIGKPGGGRLRAVVENRLIV